MRVIYAEVNGFELKLSSKSGGVQGEQNVTVLQIRFDDSWTGLGKRIIWRDATGENPVPVVLFDPVGADGDILSYATAIPAAALAYPGWCSFTIEGCTVKKGNWIKAMGTVGSLEVRASEVIYQPEDETPSQTQQILAALGSTEQTVAGSAEEAKSWAVGGTNSREGEDTDNARFYAGKASESAEQATAAKTEAQTAKNTAETAKTGAESAAAEAGQSAAAAQAAKSAAETAAETAQTAKSGAESAKTAALAAQGAAETAKTEAETAAAQAAESKTVAETAKTEAQTARAGAESAQAAAETHADRAWAAVEAEVGIQSGETEYQLPVKTDWMLCRGSGVFAAVVDGGYVSGAIAGRGAYSDDGLLFHETTLPVKEDNNGYYSWYGLCYGNGVFVTVGRDYQASPSAMYAAAAYSTDRGRTWNLAEFDVPMDGLLGTICFDGTRFVAVAKYLSNGAAYSEDGVHWHSDPEAFSGLVQSGVTALALCCGNGMCAAPLLHTAQVVVLRDGSTEWELVNLPEEAGTDWRSCCFDMGKFVFVSGRGAIVTSADLTEFMVVRVPSTAETPAEERMTFYDVCCGKGRFVAVGINGANVPMAAWSLNGAAWHMEALPETEYGRWFRICYGDGLFLTSDTDLLAWSLDGVHWMLENAALKTADGTDVTSQVAQAVKPYLAWVVGIQSAVLNDDFTLTLTYTNGTTYTTPSIRGPEGIQGPTGAKGDKGETGAGVPDGGAPFSYLSRTEDGQGTEWVNIYPEIPIVDAESEDGCIYTATVDGMTELHTGMLLTIIPNFNSNTLSPKLNVNNIGEVEIRRAGSRATVIANTGNANDWIRSERPILLQYNGLYWVALAQTKPYANDLSGIVDIEHGGTGRNAWAPNALVFIDALGEFSVIDDSVEADSFLFSPGPGETPEWASPKDVRDFLGCLPAGGTAGQFLCKQSGTDYDTHWVTVTDGNGVYY